MYSSRYRYSFTGFVYGQAFDQQLTYSPDWVARYERSVLAGMRRLKISKQWLKGKKVLDIGTGGYGIQFAKFGAERVDCFDLNWSAIQKLKYYCDHNGISNLNAYQGDVADNLGNRKYDLIYLSGIFQHFSVPSHYLDQFSSAMNIDGLMYLDFYRSGRFRWFLVTLLRHLVKKRHFPYLLERSRELFIHNDLIDDLFVEYIHCYHPDRVEYMCRQVGLAPISKPTSKDLVDQREEYDHNLKLDHIFNTLILKKKGEPLGWAADLPTCQEGGIKYREANIVSNIHSFYDLIGNAEIGRFKNVEEFILKTYLLMLDMATWSAKDRHQELKKHLRKWKDELNVTRS